jgi:hypothetical protein
MVSAVGTINAGCCLFMCCGGSHITESHIRDTGNVSYINVHLEMGSWIESSVH